jgi:hypothetical protein
MVGDLPIIVFDAMNVSFPPPGINFQVKKVSVCISLFDV